MNVATRKHTLKGARGKLNFEINRAGKGLAPARRHVLDQAKGELRRVFGRPPSKPG